MLWKFMTLKNLQNKTLYHKCFAVHLVSSQGKNSVTSIRPLFIISTNTIASCIRNYKYLQCLLKNSKFKDFNAFYRNFNTNSKRFCNKNAPPPPPPPTPSGKRNYFYVVLGLICAIQFFEALAGFAKPMISWEEFRHQLLEKGEVKKIRINPEMELIIVETHAGVMYHNIPVKYFILNVPDLATFEEKLRETEKQLGISPQDTIPIEYFEKSKLAKIFSYLLIILLLWLIASKFSSFNISTDFLRVNKAKFTLVDPLSGQGKGVKFSDVAGLKEAKIEIMDFVDYLKRPEVYRNLGAKVPKGALLLGPPGCGKTLLAKAVATEANVPFLSMNGSEFIEIIGGLGAARVRDLFKEAKKRIPCIIYIDEIDAIGKKREGLNTTGGGIGEEEQTLNQLLVEMDGMVSNEGVVLLASTNRADVLDAALLRPGRFDRHILIDFPTAEERQQIFEQHLKGIHLEHKAKVYSKRMAYLTPGFSGADIANVCNEAALHAARLKKQIVQGDDLEYAVERVVGGTEKRSSALSPEEKRMLAYYEAGRALVGWMSKYGEALLKITIVSRTDSPAGWTQFSQGEKFLYSENDLMGKMCMGLGGQVAVSLLFNRVTTAGEKDLKKVTRLAYSKIKRFGMNKNIGLMSFEESNGSVKKPYSKALGNLFDQEAKLLVTAAYKETEKILEDNKDKLIKLAEELLKRETLNYEDVVKLIGPPAYKKKKLLEPLEFSLSLDQAAGPEPEPTPPQDQSKPEYDEKNM